MFWKIVKWGGTIAVVLLLITAVLTSVDSAQTTDQDQPAPVTTKKFNFN